MRERLGAHEPWRRVERRYITTLIVTSLIGGVIFAAVCVAVALLGDFWPAWIALAAVIVVEVFDLILAPRRARAIGYLLRDDDLLFGRGIMLRRLVAVPYGRMQLVDVTAGPISRMLGLAELKFVTAAASANITIPGLDKRDAERLRDELIALAESRRAGL